MPKILLDYDIAEVINFLNSKQTEVTNVNHTWAKDYVKYDRHELNQYTYFFQVVDAQVNLNW